MATLVSADLHIDHFNIMGFCRPQYQEAPPDAPLHPVPTGGFLARMNEDIVARWNAVVQPDDDAILLGDAVMGHRSDSLKYIERLNGRKKLIPGNHDYVHPMHGPKFLDKWLGPYKDAGFEILDVQERMTINGHSVLLCHFPFDGDHTDDVRYMDWRPTDDGGLLIHGHVHDLWKINGRQINAGCDVWDMQPISIETLVDTLVTAQ